MIDNQPVVALIPVRGGSQGVARKNELDLGGYPLMAWAVKVASRVDEIDRVLVSTEDDRLAEIGQKYGAEVESRNPALASNTAGVFDVIMDLRRKWTTEGVAFRYMVLLEATSPFRSAEMIRKALHMLSQGYDSVASFCRCRTHPLQSWKIEDSGEIKTFIDGANPWVTRQSLIPAYQLTGEVYAFDLHQLAEDSASLLVGRSGALILEEELCIDINTPTELELARLLFPKSPLQDLL